MNRIRPLVIGLFFGPAMPLYPNGLAELIRSVGLLPEGR